jgi:transposase InsO family protein
VLSHRVKGEDRAIAFASSSLSDTQKKYSQMDKEALAIIFGVKRFHQYLYGRQFTIVTDHEPLTHLFKPDNAVPVHSAARLQRWSLILAGYQYNIEYRNTKQHANADSMSRLPLPQIWQPKSSFIECFFFEEEVVTNISSERIRKKTSVDPVLSRVLEYCQIGWPNQVDHYLEPYQHRKDELTIQQGCVLWGSRVIIPAVLQRDILNELHNTHLGITKMKMLARGYVWWPQLDKHIEQLVSSCDICQELRAEPKKAQVHPWIYPSSPWSRVHIDYAGPVKNAMHLVIVDAYSKFPEIVQMSSTTSQATIQALREVFSRYGLPEILVSDNGPQFVSRELENFCSQNGILHRTSAAYKPATNGQAERVVQILKVALRQAAVTKQNVDILLARYLMMYRNTPHCTTGESPAMLLMGRRLRTKLDLVFPSINKTVAVRQEAMMKQSAHRGARLIQAGDKVQYRNFQSHESPWKFGEVSEVLGARHYIVKDGNVEMKRHLDQIIKIPEKTVHQDKQASQSVPSDTCASAGEERSPEIDQDSQTTDSSTETAR